MDVISGSVDRTSSSEAKIACSGRSSEAATTCTRDGSKAARRAGLATHPPVPNEWVRGVCEKPRIKCAECPNRRFFPVTDDVIRWHLSGRDADGQPFVAGVFPLLQDETCFFLAVDSTRPAGATMPRRFVKRAAI
jgi:hypothetical protein